MFFTIIKEYNVGAFLVFSGVASFKVLPTIIDKGNPEIQLAPSQWRADSAVNDVWNA